MKRIRLRKYHDSWYDFVKPEEFREVTKLKKELFELGNELKKIRQPQHLIRMRGNHRTHIINEDEINWRRYVMKFELKEYDELEEQVIIIKENMTKDATRLNTLIKRGHTRHYRYLAKVKREYETAHKKSPA